MWKSHPSSISFFEKADTRIHINLNRDGNLLHVHKSNCSSIDRFTFVNIWMIERENIDPKSQNEEPNNHFFGDNWTVLSQS